MENEALIRPPLAGTFYYIYVYIYIYVTSKPLFSHFTVLEVTTAYKISLALARPAAIALLATRSYIYIPSYRLELFQREREREEHFLVCSSSFQVSCSAAEQSRGFLSAFSPYLPPTRIKMINFSTARRFLVLPVYICAHARIVLHPALYTLWCWEGELFEASCERTCGREYRAGGKFFYWLNDCWAELFLNIWFSEDACYRLMLDNHLMMYI